MEDTVSILIVSSPSPSHPTTHLIRRCIDTVFQCLPELSNCKIIVVLDGYKKVPTCQLRVKSGKIDEELELKYNGYHTNLEELFRNEYLANSPTIYRSPMHLGFALGVKAGLELVTTPYCLVCQHDRKFIRKFPYLRSIIDRMDIDSSIRYVGFPSINNCKINNTTRSRYLLELLNGPKFRKSLIIGAEGNEGSDDSLGQCNNIFLQPLIFWYDSQHICHVKRYLEIYRPFTNIPADLKRLFGTPAVKKMIMRNGDFIEDRFGQMQRNVLARLAGDAEAVEKAFNWFGSYLLWEQDKLYQSELFQSIDSEPVGSHSFEDDCSNEDINDDNKDGNCEEADSEEDNISQISQSKQSIDSISNNDSSNIPIGGGGVCNINTNNCSAEVDLSQADIIHNKQSHLIDSSITACEFDEGGVIVGGGDEYSSSRVLEELPCAVTGVFLDPAIYGYCSHSTCVYVQHMNGRKYDHERQTLFNKLYNKNSSI